MLYRNFSIEVLNLQSSILQKIYFTLSYAFQISILILFPNP